jgi:hypothetical protein
VRKLSQRENTETFRLRAIKIAWVVRNSLYPMRKGVRVFLLIGVDEQKRGLKGKGF